MEWELLAYLRLSLSNKRLSKEKALDEHLLIQKYLSNIGSAFLAEHNVEVSIGDDASVISSNKNDHLVNSLDTSIEGVHFLKTMSASDIAYRSCVVALSDIAASGAHPAWYSLALTLPDANEAWISDFSKGLSKFSDDYRIPLIGGDTTKGTLSITVQVMGTVEAGKSVLRSNAKEDQLILVSGEIGRAYLGLKELTNKTILNKENIDSYLCPKARIDLGLELNSLASAAIDISDGLLQDLNLICISSEVGADVYLEKIPTPVSDKTIEIINSGDDYELCFTADKSHLDKILMIGKELNIPITQIGTTNSSRELVLYNESNEKIDFNSGYQHF